MTYSEKLRDPRWQKKRLEIYERAGWICEICGTANKSLNAHHVTYVKGRNPWEYRPELLQCLCETCHKEREELFRKITDSIKIALKDFPTERLVKCAEKLMATALEEL